jgi:DNA repair protein RadC
MARASSVWMKSRLNSSYTIKDWPLAERPREKLLHLGAHGLTDAELLAILIRTGTGKETALDLAREILRGGTTLRVLGTKTPSELMRLKGIGPAKAVELLAAFEVGRRLQGDDGMVRQVIRTPEDVAHRLIPRLRDRPTEVFLVLVLDARNAVKQETEISRGTLNASIVHPREVFKTAIDAAGASIIVVHNHPSGNPEPSREDIEITRQLADAGRIIGIPLNDHVIIAGNSYTSLAERGEV